ncbi:hypothetical protein JYK14_01190 [Siccirubricoccus sp. KC 17139]|uniref:Uncharacterized protein n=1 Tax=Siccirubricoccus soli TaxID=2899147 RepID=A0ABT1D186_9PROT|nr:hypothetical protein [Siccirubricoccus soli]MCO6414795.1 hypothetical protein [Siccirubricoccus soli]MCP2680925.1 hypothetical protein [Siccirubricoccus soli]
MDVIEAFLTTLHEGNGEGYKDISQLALTVYQSRGMLTDGQAEWALKAAKRQKVKVPVEFHDMETFTPKARLITNVTPMPSTAGDGERTTRVFAAMCDDLAALFSEAADRFRGL